MSSSSDAEEMQVEPSDDEVLTDQDGESEAGDPETESSDEVATTPKAVAMDASATESDDDASDDDEVDDDKDVPPPKADRQRAKVEKIAQDILDTYSKRKGKQLYIRFPEKLPEDSAEFEAKAKSCSDLIVNVHKPRQKHARFCLVDFATTEDRDKALKKLQKNISENKLVVSVPRTESEEFVKTLAERKMKKIEQRRAKMLLKKQAKKLVKDKEFTPSIVVFNIPKSASIAQIKELFPDAVDIQVTDAPKKFKTSTATVTLPTPMDARTNFKRKLTLGGNKLFIRFNNENKKKKKSKSDGPKDENEANTNGKKEQKNKKKGKLGEKKPVDDSQIENKNKAKLNQKKLNKKNNQKKVLPAKNPKIDEGIDGKRTLGPKPNKVQQVGKEKTKSLQIKKPGNPAPPQKKKPGITAPKKNGVAKKTIQKNKLKKQNKTKVLAM